MITGKEIANKALERLTGKEILYSSEDCQKFVEVTHRLAGVNMPDYRGSNDMLRNACTAVYLISSLAAPPVGALAFIVKHDGNEPARYQDDLGNASHVGIYAGNNEVVDSSASAGKVRISKLSIYTHYGLTKGVEFAGDIDVGSKPATPAPADMAVVLQPVRLRKSTDTSSSKNVIRQLGIGDQLTVLAVTTKGKEVWAHLEQTIGKVTHRGWACVEDSKTRYISLPGVATVVPEEKDDEQMESLPIDREALRREFEANTARNLSIFKILYD